MDVLSDILAALRFRGTLYFSTEFHPPWAVRVPRFRRVARFHMVIRGATWVRVEHGGDPVRLETGDLILVPHGAEHVISDGPETPPKSLDDVVTASGFTGRGALVIGDADSGGGAPTRLLCGHFEFDDAVDHPLLDRLPPALVVRSDDEVRNYPLQEAFRLIVREVREGHPGHEAVVARLSEILFVQVVRTWARRAEHDRGVLAALADSRLGAALEAIHAEPHASWTLETLSRRAAMGRSAFVERFGSVVGETPLRYLTRWRMQLAKRLLTDRGLSLEQIAERVGYDSAAAFSRVFKKTAGVSPGQFRSSSEW